MANTLINILNADLQRALENVREAAARIWARPLHRYFTDHTLEHSQRIIALLDGLAAGMMQTDKRLTSTEVFVLLAAAYLHDIGMQNEKFAGGDLVEIREHHHQQTAEMIYAVFEDPAEAFPIPLARDPAIVEAVALVAKGHRRVDLDANEYEPFAHGGETLRLRLLAALLRFGDELDIDHRRIDLEQMKLMTLPVDSQLHWWKCHYVSGVSIVDEYIRITYRFPQDRPDYEGLIVPLVEDEIRAKHADLEEIFRAHAVKVAVGKSQVRLMRLVQPLPEEVEALARERGEPISKDELRRPEGDQPERTGAPSTPSASPGGATYDIHIQHAQGLAIGDGAQVVQPGGERDRPAGADARDAGSLPNREQRCTDLARHMRETLDLIKQYEDQRRLADDPKAKRRAEREIADLQNQLSSYETEYRELGCI